MRAFDGPEEFLPLRCARAEVLRRPKSLALTCRALKWVAQVKEKVR